MAIWRAGAKLKHVEKQRALSEAAASEGAVRLQRLAALIELSYEPIVLWDVEQGIIEWNKGCEQLYGYSKSEAIGQRSHELLKTKFPESLETYQKALDLEGHWSGELRHLTKGGHEVTVESRQQLLESPSQRLVLETDRDITERKQTEQERERSLLREQVLRVGAERRLDVKPIALTSVIKAALESVQPSANAKEIQLQMIVDPAADNVKADAARLRLSNRHEGRSNSSQDFHMLIRCLAMLSTVRAGLTRQYQNMKRPYH